MKDSQILSGFQDALSAPAIELVTIAYVFDACQVGVVLRALLLVELVLALGVMFVSDSFIHWAGQWSLLTAGALPALLAWLLVVCVLKRWLARLSGPLQVLAGAALGALAGMYGCGVLVLTGLLESRHWFASASCGALLAAVQVNGWILRFKGRAPADTAARLRSLQSRIRPHFLFNTLNSAIALVRAEPAKAEALLEDLSDLFRHALMEPDEFVTLADEIGLARRYLAIEQVRFGERLQVLWTLDPQADGARLPSLILQPLVENAVRHGVEPSATGAQVHISTQRRGALVRIKVTNSVPAGAGTQGAGLALQNVRERLALLHDVQGRFHYGLKDGVFRVLMEVPA